MKTHIATEAVSALLLICFSNLCFADTVYLVNGQKVEGKIIAQDQESVTVQTDVGEMKIPTEKIRSVETEKVPSFTIYLVTGQKVEGKLVVQDNKFVTVQTDVGEMKIPREKIRSITAVEAPSLADTVHLVTGQTATSVEGGKVQSLADTVYLVTGQKVGGKIIAQDSTSVTVQTEVGEIKIPQENIRSVESQKVSSMQEEQRPTRPDTVYLVTGQKVVGRIHAQDKDSVTIQTEVGEIKISREKIRQAETRLSYLVEHVKPKRMKTRGVFIGIIGIALPLATFLIFREDLERGDIKARNIVIDESTWGSYLVLKGTSLIARGTRIQDEYLRIEAIPDPQQRDHEVSIALEDLASEGKSWRLVLTLESVLTGVIFLAARPFKTTEIELVPTPFGFVPREVEKPTDRNYWSGASFLGLAIFNLLFKNEEEIAFNTYLRDKKSGRISFYITPITTSAAVVYKF